MKKKLCIILLGLMIVLSVIGLVACGEKTEDNAHVHNYSQEVIDPTCTEQGYTTHACSCGDGYVDNYVDALGHDYIKNVVPPTKTNEGYTEYTCNVCQESYKDIIPATGSIGLTYAVNSDGKTCSITGIGSCTDTEIIIPTIIDTYTVTEIGEKAFENCQFLKKIIIPNSITLIGRESFGYCDNLETVVIGMNVSSFGNRAFKDCQHIKEVHYNGTIDGWLEIEFKYDINNELMPDSNPLFWGKELFIQNEKVKELNITGAKEIKNIAFIGCTTIESVKIGSKIKSIGMGAFAHCENIKMIQMENTVESIGMGAFSENTKLISIVLSNQISEIFQLTFNDCYRLEQIFFSGNKEDFKKIIIDDNKNDGLIEATIFFYSETQPTEEGNYWHYDIDGFIVIWEN